MDYLSEQQKRTPDPCQYQDDALTPVPLACYNYLWRSQGKCTTSFMATDNPNVLQLEGTNEKFSVVGKTLGMARADMKAAATNPLWNPPICNRTGVDTIVAERTKLKELDMLVTQYKTAHVTYLSNEKSGNVAAASNNRETLKALNENILAKLQDVKQMNDSIYPQGIAYQQRIEKNNPALNSHLHELYQQHELINEHIRDYTNAFGAKEESELSSASRTWHYVFYLVAACTIAVFVVRAYTTDDQHSVEIVILIVAAILAIVHFSNYLTKKLS